MRIRRHPERAATDRTELYAILDAGWVGTLAVADDGVAQVVPVLYARDGDAILVHGSTGAGTLRLAAESRPATFCVNHLDGFVYAASLFESSANYRSAVVTGVCERLDGPAGEAALHVLSEHLMPGRAEEVRASTRREYAATLVLRLPVTDDGWTAKTRVGPPGPEPDADPSVWMGVLSVRPVFGAPEPTDASRARGIPVPGSIARRLAAGR